MTNTVAIVDDVLPNALLLKGYLKHLDDIEAVTFTDPVKALEWCVENVPDLVLLDFLMPRMDGAEFLNRFNDQEHLRDVPVLIITGAEDKETLQEGLEAGALDVLHKPVNEVELAVRVRNMLLLRTRQLAIQAQAEQLRRSEKMEALGQMAGGIAHEFNNILQSIQGFTSMALKKADDPDRVQMCLEEVLEASVRAADLTGQILSFSRKEILEPKVVRARDVVHSVERLLRGSLEVTIDLRIGGGDLDTCVEVDVGRLSEAIVNLAINGAAAMPDGGALAIGCTDFQVDAEFQGSHGDQLAAGHYVRFDVTDQGTGMDPSTLEHIFEPFFTTKDVDQGTGLGLSMAHGMIKRSGGLIDVKTAEGVGTTFTLYLPVADAEPIELARIDPKVDCLRGTETILVAEDDPQVRAFVKAVLEELGYTAIVAPDGPSAIAECEAHADRIDLLVTDVIMPEMNGVELARSLIEKKPDLKVVFMTGYVAEHSETLKQAGPDLAVLKKPFEQFTLSQAIREALDAAA